MSDQNPRMDLENDNARLRAGISWARGMCTDREEHWRIDEFLGLVLAGSDIPEPRS